MSNKIILKKAGAILLSTLMALSAAPLGYVYAKDAETSFQIVHTNDMHGYYTSTKQGAIGFAALKTLIDDEGADLVLDIGDTFHGQAFATAEQGLGIAELMKSIGYDAMTPGNHDWSYGADRLKTLETVGGFSILAANVVTDDGMEYFENPYLVKEVTADDGTALKVGVVGVIDDAFYSSTNSENIAGLKFEEEAAKASETAQMLREKENCDVVLAITHQKDCKGFVSGIKGIDAVIAGHEHILIDESYPDSEGKEVCVVEAGYYFNDVGVLEITYDSKNKTVAKTSEKVYTAEQTSALKENEAVKTQILEIEDRQEKELGKSIGSSDKDYPYSWEGVRVSEQEIGKLVTQSYIDMTGADMAFENAGGIRSGINKGEITYKDIISISPYGNVVVTKELTGGQIIDVLNHSLEIAKSGDEIYALQKQASADGQDPYQYSWPDNSGSVLQYSGITFETDENNCVKAAVIGDKPIDENKIYTVAANNFVADSIDYPALAESSIIKEYGTCEEALKKYIESNSFEKDKSAVLTRGEVVTMLLDAADDYNSDIIKNDIITGYEDGELHEEQPVTRVEALVMIDRAFRDMLKASQTNTDSFTDIPLWAKTELECVFASGIVFGTGDGKFSPYENVTMGQMEDFISRAVSSVQGD